MGSAAEEKGFEDVLATLGAGGGTRTPTALRPPGPKPGASSNSATPADSDCRRGWLGRLQEMEYEMKTIERVLNSWTSASRIATEGLGWA